MLLYPKWWRRHFLAVELGIALAVTALLLIWWRYGSGAPILKEVVRGNRGQVYGTFAWIFGSLLGFAITALSVVLGFSSSDRLAVLKNSAYYKQLWEVFTSAIRVLGITTTLWLLALFLDRETHPRPFVLVLCLAVTFLATLRLARCVWVLERIVEIITSKPQ